MAPGTPGGANPQGTRYSPWFRSHPEAAAAVIACSWAAVLALQALDSRASDAIALLYSLPIGLAAVTFGLWGGLGTAGAAYLAFGLFTLTSSGAHVGLDGWLSRAAAMFLLGGLLGRASDQTAVATRMALAHQHQRLIAEERSSRYSEGIELSDSVLQHVAVAKWKMEQGDIDAAAELLTRALVSGQKIVGELLPSRSSGKPPADAGAGSQRAPRPAHGQRLSWTPVPEAEP